MIVAGGLLPRDHDGVEHARLHEVARDAEAAPAPDALAEEDVAAGAHARVCDVRALLARTGPARRRLASLAAALDALSPLAVLERGYSLAADPAGRLVRDAATLAPGPMSAP